MTHFQGDTSHTPLRLYGRSADTPALEWSWVEQQLAEAGTYWLVARSPGHPHPRPVWGIWHSSRLYLSVGTPTNARAIAVDPTVTVHLDSGTDVVIVEGQVREHNSDPDVVDVYNAKYQWDYDVDEYGPLAHVAPQTVLAWRTAGWAGRDSFSKTGRWRFV